MVKDRSIWYLSSGAFEIASEEEIKRAVNPEFVKHQEFLKRMQFVAMRLGMWKPDQTCEMNGLGGVSFRVVSVSSFHNPYCDICNAELPRSDVEGTNRLTWGTLKNTHKIPCPDLTYGDNFKQLLEVVKSKYHDVIRDWSIQWSLKENTDPAVDLVEMLYSLIVKEISS